MSDVQREYLGGISAVVLVSLLAWLLASHMLLGKSVVEIAPEASANGFEAGAYLLDVHTDPDKPEPGENRLSIQARDKQGQPVTAASVRVVIKTLAETDQSEGAFVEFPVDEELPGAYTAQVRIPASGTWPVIVERRL